jgi:hypothetical protein
MNTNQATGTANNANQAKREDYFDLHVKGVGYLNRIREIGKSSRDKFLACSVSAMHGRCKEPTYSYFDLKVAGAEAAELIRSLWGDVEAGNKVFIAFRAGDIYAEPYEVDERDQNRQPTGKKILRATIKGRLLQITNAQVNGVVVFRANAEGNGSPDDNDSGEGGSNDAGTASEGEGTPQGVQPEAQHSSTRSSQPPASLNRAIRQPHSQALA